MDLYPQDYTDSTAMNNRERYNIVYQDMRRNDDDDQEDCDIVPLQDREIMPNNCKWFCLP